MAASEKDRIDRGDDEPCELFHYESNSYRLLADIVSFLPDPTFVVDKEGVVVSWNGAIEDLTGIKAEDILGKGDYDYAIPIYGCRRPILVDLVLNPDANIEAEYESLQWDGMNFICEAFVPSLGQRGSYIWAKAAPLYDSSGNGIGAIESLRDITERKKAESALQDSKEYLNQIINSIGDPIFVKDHEHRFVLINSAFCSIAGSPPEELLGMTDYDFFPKEQADIFWKLDDLVLETGEQNINEEEITDAHGDIRTIITKKTLFKDKSENNYIVGVIRDISERKQMEKELRQSRDDLKRRITERTADLEAKNSEMERFIYAVSHDLRSPLISMSGFLGFLKADVDKGDMGRFDADLSTVSCAVTKMDRLLLDTLELSRIGRIINPPENVPFREIVSEALMQSSAKVLSKNVLVTVDENLPTVQVDRMRFVEVLVNLLENSVKYIGDQPQPEIEIGKRLEGEDTVFFVRDNGIGIDSSLHDKVFELFYKVDKKSEGSGAGLAIVKKIVEVHRGRIWIESQLEKGCTVCFTVPHVKDVFERLNN